MSKKIKFLILSVILGVTSASAVAPQPDPQLTGETVGEQYVAEPAYAPSEEVDYVLESETARKMKQAKKAEDARKYDSYGGGITIIAMCIVIGALIVLSILFYIFGKISSLFIKSKKKKSVKAMTGESPAHPESNKVDSGEVIAAISAALAQHFGADHDMQDTILTIRRMRKAYSPWNSKIYNMRHEPQVAHHSVKIGK